MPDDEEIEQEFECFFCGTFVSGEYFCWGCQVVVCDSCENAYETLPLGPHEPRAHRKHFNVEVEE